MNAIHFLRFIVFLVALWILAYNLYWLLERFMEYISRFYTFWIIFLGIALFGIVRSLNTFTFGYVAYILMKLSPYKQASFYIGSLMIVGHAIKTFIALWQIIDFSFFKHWVLFFMFLILWASSIMSFIIGLYNQIRASEFEKWKKRELLGEQQ